MAKKDRLTEEIKYLTEMLRLTWAILAALGAGTVGVLIKEVDVRVIAVAGALGMIIIAFVLLRIQRTLRTRIQELEEI
jgi:hypothetical protein